TVVFGVNVYDEKDGPILSCASCTTNCVAPILEIIDRHFGIRKAMMNTMHAYTASQGLVDGPNHKLRHGRAGAENLVPATTGAATATTQVLPALRERFKGTAVRAPVPICSLSDVVMLTERATSVDEVNKRFLMEASSERYEGVVGVTED